jgi:hypothetical protein
MNDEQQHWSPSAALMAAAYLSQLRLSFGENRRARAIREFFDFSDAVFILEIIHPA